MQEHKTLYWTHGRASRGIISLVNDGIVIFHTDKKIITNNEKLRDIVYANINFKEIVDIGVEITFLRGKVIFLTLQDKVFERIVEDIPKHLRSGLSINPNIHRLIFEVNIDSKEEILDFVERASILKKKKKK